MNRVEYLSRCNGYSALMEANMMEFIEEYIRIHGYAPSYREIGQGVGLQGTSSVYYHMKRLFEQGRLETDLPDRFSVPRAFRIARG
jgi:repressor LexA